MPENNLPNILSDGTVTLAIFSSRLHESNVSLRGREDIVLIIISGETRPYLTDEL